MPEQTHLTLKGIVNTWECDENAHLNIQFYWSRFEQADRQFRRMTGMAAQTDRGASSGHRSRHVRYLAELRGAASVMVRSRVATDEDGALVVLHELIDCDRDILSATAVDRQAIDTATAARLAGRGDPAPLPPGGRPRGIVAPTPALVPGGDAAVRAALEARGGVLTCRTVIEPAACRPDGRISDRGLVGHSVDAAPGSWAHVGFTRAVLDAEGVGRVALEKRLTVIDRPSAGDMMEIVTEVLGFDRTTFSFRHFYFDSATGRLITICEVTVLAMHLATRKAVRIPPEVLTRLTAAASATLSPQIAVTNDAR